MRKLKPFNIRITAELLLFLKQQSLKHERSINVIITELIEKYRRRVENA